MESELKEMFMLVFEAAGQFLEDRDEYMRNEYANDSPERLDAEIRLDQLDNALVACTRYVKAH